MAVARRIGQRRWDLELVNGVRVKLAAHRLEASLARLERLQQETKILDRPGQVVDLTLMRVIAIGATPLSADDAKAKRSAAGLSPPRSL